MRVFERAGWLRVIVLVTVAVALLAVLLVPHAETVPAAVVLLPVLLFGMVQQKSRLRLSEMLEGPATRSLPYRASLFQRPPPRPVF